MLLTSICMFWAWLWHISHGVGLGSFGGKNSSPSIASMLVPGSVVLLPGPLLATVVLHYAVAEMPSRSAEIGAICMLQLWGCAAVPLPPLASQWLIVATVVLNVFELNFCQSQSSGRGAFFQLHARLGPPPLAVLTRLCQAVGTVRLGAHDQISRLRESLVGIGGNFEAREERLAIGLGLLCFLAGDQ